MITEYRDSTGYFTALDAANLLRLLQDRVQGSPHSAGSLQLSFFKQEQGSVTWLLKNQIEGLR